MNNILFEKVTFIAGIFICCILLWKMVRKENWNSPAKLFITIWTFQILFACIFLNNFLFLYYIPFIYILLAIFTFWIGWQYSNREENKKSNFSKLFQIKRNVKLIHITLILLFIVSFINPILGILKFGGNLSVLLSFDLLLELNNEISKDRYSGESSHSILEQLLLVFTYLAPLFAGYTYLFLKNRYFKIISIICILPGIFIALTQAVKMAMITSILLWISGLLASTILLQKKIVINKNNLFKFFLISLFFFSILFTSMIFRTGEFNQEIIEKIGKKFSIYAVGHLSAFGEWFTNYDFYGTNQTFGARLLSGISNQLGILKREQGLYQDITTVTNEGDITNIYTIFRVLIEDFGIIGTLFCLLLCGTVSNKLYYCIKNRNHFYLATTLLCVIYFTILWSFATTALAYTSYIVMFIIFYLLIRNSIQIKNINDCPIKE